jgi:hypothetical protein
VGVFVFFSRAGVSRGSKKAGARELGVKPACCGVSRKREVRESISDKLENKKDLKSAQGKTISDQHKKIREVDAIKVDVEV